MVSILRSLKYDWMYETVKIILQRPLKNTVANQPKIQVTTAQPKYCIGLPVTNKAIFVRVLHCMMLMKVKMYERQ